MAPSKTNDNLFQTLFAKFHFLPRAIESATENSMEIPGNNFFDQMKVTSWDKSLGITTNYLNTSLPNSVLMHSNTLFSGYL